MGIRYGLAAALAGLWVAPTAWAQPPAFRDSLFAAPFARSESSGPLWAAPLADGPVAPDRQQTALSPAAGVRDSVSLTTASAPGSLQPGAPALPTYDLTFTRQWPAALQLSAGRYDVDLSPHAGVGVSSFGGSAEAGATLQIGVGGVPAADRANRLGVREGKTFGDQDRWYLFAAVSGKAVGMNMTRSGAGDWQRAGWSSDPSSALVGDGQLGVGWRKAGMQAAFGYVHREIKVQNAPRGADNDVGDSMAAFTLSIKNHR